MSGQYITRIYTDLNGIDHEMDEAQYAAGRRATGERWYTCVLCGLDFPKSKIFLTEDGKPYCIPCSDERS